MCMKRETSLRVGRNYFQCPRTTSAGKFYTKFRPWGSRTRSTVVLFVSSPFQCIQKFLLLGTEASLWVFLSLQVGFLRSWRYTLTTRWRCCWVSPNFLSSLITRTACWHLVSDLYWKKLIVQALWNVHFCSSTRHSQYLAFEGQRCAETEASWIALRRWCRW